MGLKRKLLKIKKMQYKKEEIEKLNQIDVEEELEKDETHTLNIITKYKPPFQILLDTNFINDCIRKKLDPILVTRDSVGAECQFYITDCVYAELEKLGRSFRLALKMIRYLDHTKLVCHHKGTFADDCLLERAHSNIFIVATSDINLKQRLRKKNFPVLVFRNRKLSSEGFYVM